MPVLYLVLDLDTLNDEGLLDVKLLMLEKSKGLKRKSNAGLKRLYLDEKLKMNINNLLMYTDFI